MKKKSIILISFALAFIFISSNTCFAHKIRIFAWENGDGTIMTESKFSGGRAAKNVSVTVIESSTGKELLSGKTDTKGMYQFAIPKTASNEIEIVVNGGDGHKNSWHYTLDDTPVPPASSKTTAQKDSIQSASGQHGTQTIVPSSTRQCNSAELTQLINAALDRKLAPIHRILAESTDHAPTLQDILGGLGYIFGLAGIAAYFQSRKKNQESDT